jgi:hypothetical protein
MGMICGKTSTRCRTAADMKKRDKQPGQTTKYRPWIVSDKHPEHGAGDGCGQRQNIGQIRAPANAARGYLDRYTITDPGSDFVGDAIGFRRRTEYLGQLLTAAAARFVAAPATSLLYLDQGIGLVYLADDGADRTWFGIHQLPAAIRRDI